jgi:hypothetical protein
MAEYASRSLGEQEVEETNYVTAISKDGESVSTSTHVGKRRVVLPDEMLMLPDMEGYLWLSQEINPALITLEFLKLPVINPHGSAHNKVPPNFIQSLTPEWDAKHAELVLAAKRKAQVAALKEKVEGMKLEEAHLQIEEKRRGRAKSGGTSPNEGGQEKKAKQGLNAKTQSGSPRVQVNPEKLPETPENQRIDSPEPPGDTAPKVKEEPGPRPNQPYRRIERM